MQRQFVAIAIGIASLFGCVGGGEADTKREPEKSDAGPVRDAGGEAPSVSVDTFAARAAEATCAALERCWAPGLAHVFYELSCRELRGQKVIDSYGDLPALVAAGRVKFDAEAAAVCLAAVRNAPCDQLSRALDSLCDAAISGSVPQDGACDSDFECADDALCINKGSCPGLCRKRLGVGVGCNQDLHCQTGLVCSGHGCQPPAKLGAGCQGTLPDCQFDGICAGTPANLESVGTCLTWEEAFSGRVGDRCDVNSAPFCGPGLSCVYTTDDLTGECRELGARGAECNGGSPSPCQPGLACATDTTGVQAKGHCVDAPKAGEPCLQGSFDPGLCGPLLSCETNGAPDGGVGGTCAPYQIYARPGEACTDWSDCSTERCVSGVCVRGAGCEM